MVVGDTAFIVESGRIIREVTIARCSGGLFLVKFKDTGGGIQVKAHRLFSSEEDAEKSILGYKEPIKKNQYDYM